MRPGPAVTVALLGVLLAATVPAGAQVAKTNTAQLEVTEVQEPKLPDGTFLAALDVTLQYAGGVCTCTMVTVTLMATDVPQGVTVLVSPASLSFTWPPDDITAASETKQAEVVVQAVELEPGIEFEITLDGTGETDSPVEEVNVLPTQLSLTVPEDQQRNASQEDENLTAASTDEAIPAPGVVLVAAAIGVVAAAAQRRP